MGGAPAHPLWARIRNVPFVLVGDEPDVQLEKMATAGWESIRSEGYDGTAWVQCQTCGLDVRASQFVVRWYSKVFWHLGPSQAIFAILKEEREELNLNNYWVPLS